MCDRGSASVVYRIDPRRDEIPLFCVKRGASCYYGRVLSTRVIFIAELVGKAGVFCVKTLLKDLREEHSADFVIANGDGATGGFGIGKSHAVYLRKMGVDVITGGDQIYFKKDLVGHISKAPYILRPANFPPDAPGRGYRHFKIDELGERRIGVISLLGQSGFDRASASNPFTYLPEIVSRLKETTNLLILDFHTPTTAEKSTMIYHADGHVSAMFGTGMRVMTADARVTDKHTAVISDTGRTGSLDSVSGLEPEIEIRRYLKGIPERSRDAWSQPTLQGAVVEFDDEGRAVSIETIRLACEGDTEG
jgi:hypothetical protein